MVYTRFALLAYLLACSSKLNPRDFVVSSLVVSNNKRNVGLNREESDMEILSKPNSSPNQAQPQRQRYASENQKGKEKDIPRKASALPASRLLLPVRLKPITLLLLRIPATIRCRRLVGSGLLRVIPQRNSVTASVRAFNTLVTRAGLAQAHDGTSASFVAFRLGVPESTLALAVAAVVRVVTAGTAADGAEPEEGRDDGEGGCNPGHCQGARAEADLDVVRFEQGVQGAGEGGEEDCGSQGCEEGEEGGDLLR